MTDKFFFASDNPGRETWQLVPWVHGLGASEFSLNLMRVDVNVGPSPFIDALEQELKPYRLPDGEREHLEFAEDVPKVRSCPLWQLTEGSIAVLERYLPNGLVAEPTYSTEGWLENPRFYRDRELVLGAITHESGGFVRLAPQEVKLLASLPIVFRDEWHWGGQTVTLDLADESLNPVLATKLRGFVTPVSTADHDG